MTTNRGQDPPARVQLTAGSWVGIVGIVATLTIALFAASDRLNDRMAAGHQEIRAETAALGVRLADIATRLDERMDNLAVEMGHVRGQLDVMRGQSDVPAERRGRGTL